MTRFPRYRPFHDWSTEYGVTTAREQEEYRELRATIRERGTTRAWIFVAGIAAWAALSLATATLSAPPLGTLVPLLVLASAFEAVFALHVGVERIGRYLQVFHEADGFGWEHAAMGFGRPAGAAAPDALFVVPFVLGAALNLVPALLATPTREELIFVGGAHALFVARVVFARAAAKRQRPVDLARFRELAHEDRNRP